MSLLSGTSSVDHLTVVVHDPLDRALTLQVLHGHTSQRSVDLHSVNEHRLRDHLVGGYLLQDLVVGGLVENDQVVGLSIGRGREV